MIRLSLPPSANDLVRPVNVGGKMRLVKTSVAKDWLEHAQMVLRASGLRVMAGPLRFEAHFHLPTVSSDGSNRVKQLEDALTGIGWHDDSQVVQWALLKSCDVPAGGAGWVDFEIHPAKADPETCRRIAASDRCNGRKGPEAKRKASPRRAPKVKAFPFNLRASFTPNR